MQRRAMHALTERWMKQRNSVKLGQRGVEQARSCICDRLMMSWVALCLLVNAQLVVHRAGCPVGRS